MFFRGKKEIIGIDIGSSSVKLVQLREVKGRYHLVNLGIQSLPAEAIVDNAIMDSNSVVEAIRSLIDGHKIKIKNVATSISGHSVIIRKISLPIMTEEELESSIHWEAEQYIPFDISEVNLDFQILGNDPRDSAQMNVLLVAAKKDFVNDYVALFRECGLNPMIMDIDCFAIENAFESNYGTEIRGIVGLLNMGASAMNVNILKEGISVFTRDIQVGGNMFNEEIQKRLGFSSEDAERAKLGEMSNKSAEVREVIADAVENLSQEVQRSLDFFSATSADEKVTKLYITGGVAKTPQVKTVLEQRLGIPVEVFNPFNNISVSASFDTEYLQAVGPLLSVAAGLAMRRIGDK
jgi:type IV pilus assembly protein PilM